MDLTSLLLFMGALFFLMIVGPMRKQKKEKKFLTQLKRGDRVITKSGLHGKIIVKFDSNNRPGMQRKAVTLITNTAKGKQILNIKSIVIPKS